MKQTFSNTIIELVRGDITNQPDVDAVVNAANAQLQTGGGVAGAIHSAAGPELARACREYAPIEPGEAVITPAFNLPNECVIHCLGPVYGRDKPEDQLLSSCYREALERAEENHVKSIAFPAISTGAFGYPTRAAAKVALDTILREVPSRANVERIRFVLWGESDLQTHVDVFEALWGNRGEYTPSDPQ